MGYSRWSSSDWELYSSDKKTKPASEIFSSKSLDNTLDPKLFDVRESRDSVGNPASTAIIVAADVTGSMGIIANYLITTGLGVLFQEVLDRKPVSDPHLMVMGVGDVNYDSAPIQVSQFESDITITKWLERVYVEKGGGGNNFESYDMPYYIAANKTSIDCFEKRGKKGYLFTIGDENPPTSTSAKLIERFTGDTVQSDVEFKFLVDQASKMYNCYHIIVAEGNYARSRLDDVKSKWCDLLGQNVIVLTDYTKLSEVIVSIIQVNEGTDIDTVTSSWSGGTNLVVKTAVSGLTSSPTTPSTGVILLD